MNAAQGAPINPSGSTSVDVLMWVGALIIAVLFLGIVILLLRKRLFNREADTATNLLNDLRRMHKSGELSTEEYDAARKALTTRVAATLPTPTAAKPPRQARTEPAAGQPEPPAELRAKPGFDLTGAPLPTPPGPYDRKPPAS